MQCPQCGFANRDDARFCKRCGRGLQTAAPPEQMCAACGAALKPGARFCARCGQPTTGQPVAPPVARPEAAPPRAVSPEPPLPPFRLEVAPPVYHEAAPPRAVSPEPSVAAEGPSTQRAGRDGVMRWLWVVIAAGMAFSLACCVLSGLALLPALSETPPETSAGDPAGHDITIMVKESYLNKNLTALLPENGLRGATLDVQPGNRLVTTANFQIFVVSLDLRLTARIAVVAGEIEIAVEDIETGGLSILELLGMDNVTLGKNFTQALREQLENELGEGSQLLDITTDEEHIILKARL